MDVSKTVSDQWRFFVLHQTALALLQLHQQSIAHQDVKPSNVLLFGADKLKLGDLGRSSLRGKPAPHDAMHVAGAWNYEPPRLFRRAPGLSQAAMANSLAE